MRYEYRNILTGLYESKATEEDANTKLAENKAKFSQQESERFFINKIIVNGDDETWYNVDLDNDPEDGDYRLFIHTTGKYDLFNSLSAIKLKRQELVDEVMKQFDSVTWQLVDKDLAQFRYLTGQTV